MATSVLLVGLFVALGFANSACAGDVFVSASVQDRIGNPDPCRYPEMRLNYPTPLLVFPADAIVPIRFHISYPPQCEIPKGTLACVIAGDTRSIHRTKFPPAPLGEVLPAAAGVVEAFELSHTFSYTTEISKPVHGTMAVSLELMELSQDRLSFTRIAFKSVGIVAVPSNYSHPSAYDPSLHAKFVDESRVDTVNPGAALLARHLFVHKNTVTHRVGGGRTLRIAFVGDAQEFDGQKAHMASEVRKFVGAGFHVKYINTVCGSDDGQTLKQMRAAGADIYDVCQEFRNSDCPHRDQYQVYFTRILPRIKRWSDLPVGLQFGYRRLAALLSTVDAVNIGYFFDPDTHLLTLAKLANPRIVTFLDVGGRIGLPKADLQRPWQVYPDNEQALFTPECIGLRGNASAWLPALQPVDSPDPPVLPLAADYVLGPSQWAGNTPSVRGAGIPYVPVYPMVDVALTDPRLHVCPAPPGQLSSEALATINNSTRLEKYMPRNYIDPGVLRVGVDVVIGTAGRLAPEKNQGILIQGFAMAYERLREAGIRSRLAIIGRADSWRYAEGVMSIAQEAGLPREAVMFTGFVTPVSLPDYLSCLDVYVCPSVRETYGISVVQAMAMSLPVIHFGYGGMQDYTTVDGGLQGSTVRVVSWRVDELADHIVSLGTNPELRSRMGRDASVFIKRHASSLALNNVAARAFRTAIAERRLDFVTRLRGRVIDNPPDSLPMLIVTKNATVHDSVSSTCVDRVLLRQHRDAGNGNYRQPWPDEPVPLVLSGSVTSLTLAVDMFIEGPTSSACEYFGDVGHAVTERYGKIVGSSQDFKFKSLSLEDKCHALLLTRHADSRVCVEVCDASAYDGVSVSGCIALEEVGVWQQVDKTVTVALWLQHEWNCEFGCVVTARVMRGSVEVVPAVHVFTVTVQ